MPIESFSDEPLTVQFFELPQDLSGHNAIIGRSLMAKFRTLYFCFKTGEYMIHF